MDRLNGRIAQAYGYAVCLICVIVILISTHAVIDAAFDYANPASAVAVTGRMGPANSFEAYRMQSRMTVRTPDGRNVNGADSSVSDAQLRKLYDAELAQQMKAAKYRALRSLVSGILFLVLASVMFLLHWRWLRRTNAEPAHAQ